MKGSFSIPKGELKSQTEKGWDAMTKPYQHWGGRGGGGEEESKVFRQFRLRPAYLSKLQPFNLYALNL